jgi:glyoxylase-like metal-dependent hydrolase (beta-lactamase superfamily II)
MGGRLIDGRAARVREPARLVCHCLLIEHNDGLVLVDTGFGLNDVRTPRARLSALMLAQMRPHLQEELTAVRQIERLGFAARDVRHVLLTHLDFDHAGGLDDFPEARVHLLARERDTARARRSVVDHLRYRPGQWSSQSRWHTYGAAAGEPWFGFECVRQLAGLPPEILFIPLAGHTLGHAGVAIDLGERWLLHAGDAYFFHGEMDLVRPHCTPALRVYQRLMDQDHRWRVENQRRLRNLKHVHGSQVTLFCAHDMIEFERLTLVEGAGHKATGPAVAGPAQRSADQVEGARRY